MWCAQGDNGKPQDAHKSLEGPKRGPEWVHFKTSKWCTYPGWVQNGSISRPPFGGPRPDGILWCDVVNTMIPMSTLTPLWMSRRTLVGAHGVDPLSGTLKKGSKKGSKRGRNRSIPDPRGLKTTRRFPKWTISGHPFWRSPRPRDTW